VKYWKKAGGIVAYAWVEDRRVTGSGKTEQEAAANLKKSMEIDARLQAKVRAGRQTLSHQIEGAGDPRAPAVRATHGP